MIEEAKDRAGTSYLSYLLRMWSISGSGEVDGEKAEKWLASVESPLTREQHYFGDLESLFAFLRKMTGQPERPHDHRADAADSKD